MTEEHIRTYLAANSTIKEEYVSTSLLKEDFESLCELSIKGIRAKALEDALDLCLHLTGYSEASQDEEWEANRETCIKALKAYRKDGVG